MIKVIAIFDIGKTNKKLYLFDEKFQVVFQHEEPFPTIHDEDGFECDDIDLITEWIENELSVLVDNGEFDPIAVNFSTYGASLMFIDKEGKRLTPLYNYLKPVDGGIADELFGEYGGKAEFCRKTASPALGLLLNSGIQALWLKKERKEIAKNVKYTLHFPQYLSYNLTGEICSEPTSLGCHTMMWDFDKMEYHAWTKDKGIHLPQPVNNDTLFGTIFGGKHLFVGTGIHDSSASLVPYLKAAKGKFILASTGTWCITMNPFNSEPLTAEQLAKDCLCYLTPQKKQVKSSRLFMGHFHELVAEKLAGYFKKPFDSFKSVGFDKTLIASLSKRYSNKQLFFPQGKDNAETTLAKVDLSQFKDYPEAYTKLMVDLTALFLDSYKLVLPANDDTEILYLSGGFAKNAIFVGLLEEALPNKKVITSEINSSTALGAALVISDVFGNADMSGLII